MIFKGFLQSWRGLALSFVPTQSTAAGLPYPVTVVVFEVDMDCLLDQRSALLRSLVAQGFRVVACAPEGHIRTLTALARMGVEYQPIPATSSGLHPLNDLGVSATLFSILRREHATATLCFGEKLSVFASVAARMARIPHVFAMIEHASVGTKQGFFAPLLRLCRRLAWACNQHVFFASALDHADCRARGTLSPSTAASAVNASHARGGLLQEILKDMQLQSSTWA